jgi:homoserine dehydrogenase
MKPPFRLAIAGLGTVGTGVIKLIEANGDLIEQRTGRSLEIVGISARDKTRKRDVDLSSYRWCDNPLDLVQKDKVDAVVELIGGSEGMAANLVRKSLESGISVLTANKALLAHHGFDLAVTAEKNNTQLCYEAAVAGGIPIIKALREGYAANNIQAIYGILNGTCNYILTEMRETGRDFHDVLKEAQEHGYAETDPTFDVEGIDAAHKLCILTAIAFGTKPDFSSMEITGIRHINATDIAFADELGYKIKLLGIARRMNGKVMQILEPCLVPERSTLGAVDGVFNAVHIEGDFVKTGLLVGRGAGEGPTASAVLSDIIDLARGIHHPVFGIKTSELKDPAWLDVGSSINSYYVRLNVLDQAGVLAEVSAILRDHKVSIEAFLQRGRDPGQPVPMVMTTHETLHKDMLAACDEIAKLECVMEKPCLIPIENLE